MRTPVTRRPPAPSWRLEAGHPHALDDARPALPRSARERLGQVGRVDLSVAGEPERAEHVVDLHRRPELLGTLRADHLAVQVVGDRVGGGTPELGHPVLGAGHDHAADVAVAGGESGLGLERGVQLGGVLHQPGARLGRAERPDQPGRVPGRASREPPLLEQEDVGPAQLGQVVGDRAADHSPADDDDLSSGGEGFRDRRWRAFLDHGAGSATGDLLEQARQPASAERRRGLLVALHPPGVEVEVDRAGGLLDEAPQRPAVLAAQRLYAARARGLPAWGRRSRPRTRRRSGPR